MPHQAKWGAAWSMSPHSTRDTCAISARSRVSRTAAYSSSWLLIDTSHFYTTLQRPTCWCKPLGLYRVSSVSRSRVRACELKRNNRDSDFSHLIRYYPSIYITNGCERRLVPSKSCCPSFDHLNHAFLLLAMRPPVPSQRERPHN